MDWRQEYESRFVTAEEAAEKVKNGDRVVFTSGREALAVGLALSARKEELNGIKLLVPSPTYDFGWYDEGWEDSFELTIRMPTATCQEAIDGRRTDFDPGTLIPFIEVTDQYIGDVVLTEVSPPDDKGFCSFGSSLWAKKGKLNRPSARAESS